MTTTRLPGTRPDLRAVILDFAGVMTVHLSQVQRMPLEVPVDRAALRAVMGEMMGDHDPASLWSRLERGEVPLTMLLEHVEARVPNGALMFDPSSPYVGIARLGVRDDMVARVARWRAGGRRVALLTNNVAEWRPLWEANLPQPAASLFDAVIDSSEVGMRKPEARIYEHALAALGDAITPAESVFVDDLAVNVEGARATGLHALHATEDDAHLHTLDDWLG